VLRLTFDDPVDLGRDSSGQGHHGTLFNGPTFEPRSGGGALHFDGLDDYVLVPHHDDLMPTTQMTIAYWVRYDDCTVMNEIYAKRSDDNTQGYGCHLSATPTTATQNYFWIAGGGWRNTNTLYPNVGQWGHVAITYDGTVIKCYINGSLSQTSASFPGLILYSIVPLTLGRNSYVIQNCGAGLCQPGHGDWGNLVGAIDDFRIYRCVLSDSDLAALVAGGH
jgi:hypothetical protein